VTALYTPQAAQEIRRFAVDAPGANGATEHVEGKYVVIWRHEPTGWMLDLEYG
jgi:hypothetical protein